MNRLVMTGLTLMWSLSALSADSSQEDCASIAADTARLACYDKRNARPATPPVRVQDPDDVALTEQRHAEPERSEVAPAATETLFGRSVEEQNIALEKVAKVDHLEFIDSRVEQIDRNRLDQVTLVLGNQQIWKQTGSSRLHLKVGDTVRIERAAMGSYLLQKSSGSSSMRVKRID